MLTFLRVNFENPDVETWIKSNEDRWLKRIKSLFGFNVSRHLADYYQDQPYYDENGDIIYETNKEIVSEEVIEDCRDLNVDQIYAVMYGTIKKLINIVENHKSQIDILKIEIDNLKTMN
jgi:hypothetical protein